MRETVSRTMKAIYRHCGELAEHLSFPKIPSTGIRA
jgi:hypothetical protein